MSLSALDIDPPVGAWAFGKLPAHGDFISRGLDDETIEFGDAVLSEALALAAGRWDLEWDDVYVETPVWRFIATPGALGRNWMAGVFLASVDAVGRQFPLIAGFSASSLALLTRPPVTSSALDAAEACVRKALLDQVPIETVMAELAHALTTFPAGIDDPGLDPVTAFALPLLSYMEAAPWSVRTSWWVAGGGADTRVSTEGRWSGELLMQLFRPGAAPQTPAEGAEPNDAGEDNAPDTVINSPSTTSSS